MELVRFTQILWKRLWLIGIAVVLVTGITYALSITTPPVYSASVTLEISLGMDPSQDPYSSLRSSELVATTYVEQISSSVILQAAIDALDLSMSVHELRKMVSVEQLRDTQLIRIDVRDASPIRAKELADQIAQTFVSYSQAKQRTQYDSGLVELDRQIAELETAIEDTQKAITSLGDPDDPENRQMPELVRLELARLQSTLTSQQTRYTILLKSAEDFRLAATRYGDTITVFAPAELPGGPVGPRTTLNTLMGAISGLVLGVSAAFLLDYLDDTVVTPEDVEGAVGWTVLGSVGRIEKTKDLAGGLIAYSLPHSARAEEYRALRTRLRVDNLSNARRVLLVSSPEAGAGKTTTLVNLGVSFAQKGMQVILVDADLRRPSLHKVFGLHSEPGLTNVVSGQLGFEEAVQRTEIEGLSVLCCGPLPLAPAAVFESPAMEELFAQLHDAAELVLVDLPPVLGLADVALLASHADGLLLVVEAGATGRDTLRRTAQSLDRLETDVVGVVLNKCLAGESYDRYYAGYAAQRRSGEDPALEGFAESLSDYVHAMIATSEPPKGATRTQGQLFPGPGSLIEEPAHQEVDTLTAKLGTRVDPFEPETHQEAEEREPTEQGRETGERRLRVRKRRLLPRRQKRLWAQSLKLAFPIIGTAATVALLGFLAGPWVLTQVRNRPTSTLVPSPTASDRVVAVAAATSTPRQVLAETISPTQTPAPTATPTATMLPTQTPAATATALPTETQTQTATATARPTQTATATARPTRTATATTRPTRTATATARPTRTATATARPTQMATSIEAPTATPTTVLEVGSWATAIRSASVLPVPVYAPGAELDYLEPEERVVVLGRSPSSYGDWLYVETERGVQGYAYAPYLRWEGEPGALPTVQPTVTATPQISPTVPPAPLAIEHVWWGSPCVEGKRVVVFDIKVRGGNGTYTFYWNDTLIEAEPNVNDPGVYIVIPPGEGGWTIGTIRVVSGDQSVSAQASGRLSAERCP